MDLVRVFYALGGFGNYKRGTGCDKDLRKYCKKVPLFIQAIPVEIKR